jgi:endonuclease/exonuclease/phosphatase family metal-dependent hydrolase
MSMLDYAALPRLPAEDLARLRRRIRTSGIPAKQSDRNLVIGTWNIRAFGDVHPAWEENPGSPKRNLRALAYLAEVVERFDVLAVQEVKRDLSGIRRLLDWLGPDWGLIVTDVTLGAEGNAERLAFLFDRRRVQPSGLAGEIVLAPTPAGDPVRQFARTPYAVGFRAGTTAFVLVTAHILFGAVPAEREPELRAIAAHVAREMRDRAERAPTEEGNLIVLGDFNIDRRGDDPLFQAFVSSGLTVPEPLREVRSAVGTVAKHYDQIAWFMGALDLPFSGRAGAIDFAGAVYRDLSLREMSFRVSDHLPLWVEFRLDRAEERLAQALGLDPAAPDPLSSVPD